MHTVNDNEGKENVLAKINSTSIVARRHRIIFLLYFFPNQIYRYVCKIFNRCEVNVTDVFSSFFLLLLNIRNKLFQSLFSNKRVLLAYLSFFCLSSRLQPDYHMIIQHLTKRKND